MVRYLVVLPFLNLTRLRLYRPNNLVAIEQAERVESLFHLRVIERKLAQRSSRGNEGGFLRARRRRRRREGTTRPRAGQVG